MSPRDETQAQQVEAARRAAELREANRAAQIRREHIRQRTREISNPKGK